MGVDAKLIGDLRCNDRVRFRADVSSIGCCIAGCLMKKVHQEHTMFFGQLTDDIYILTQDFVLLRKVWQLRVVRALEWGGSQQDNPAAILQPRFNES